MCTVGVANLFDITYTEHLSYLRDPSRTKTRVPEPGCTLYVNVAWRP